MATLPLRAITEPRFVCGNGGVALVHVIPLPRISERAPAFARREIDERVRRRLAVASEPMASNTRVCGIGIGIGHARSVIRQLQLFGHVEARALVDARHRVRGGGARLGAGVAWGAPTPMER